MNHIPNIPRRDRSERRPRPPRPASGEPILNLPAAVSAMLVTLVVIHVGRGLLSPLQDEIVLVWFAFIPARYAEAFFSYPGGRAADLWTFVTYALLHGNWMHLASNCIWLVVFGAAVARRFGALRFWVLSAAAAIGGAGLHLALHAGETIPVVGASAAIAGLMAAAARFVFDAGGPVRLRSASVEAYRKPARSLIATLTNRTALTLIIVFFAANLLIGVTSSMAGGLSIAWEAHLGGFLVGLLAFRLFDPVPR